MMKSAIALVFLACACAAPASIPPTPEPEALTLTWRTGGFAQPESVALSDDGGFLYVSNVNGEPDAKDGNGFISRLSVTGEMLQREWASGFDAPKGLLRSGDALYLTDIDQIVALDARTGAVRTRTPAPGARFLNDITETPGGLILASDSATRRIYVLRNGAAEIWLEDPLLAAINGFLPEPNRLIVTTMQGRLLAIDYQTRAITTLAEGLGDGDGVGALGQGRYLVSAWPGRILAVAADGTHRVLLDTQAEPRYQNDFLLLGDTLYQAQMAPGDVSAYRVTGIR
ncbi:periplasmic ATP/GTP-binding protein [alpha proteobacterium U9-1i]|nr:periplasmic ATP/GTP-binding protein [alpha proteobacterium U9-1i]